MSTPLEKVSAVCVCVEVMQAARDALQSATVPHPQFDQVDTELRDALASTDAVMLQIIQANSGVLWEAMSETQRQIVERALA